MRLSFVIGAMLAIAAFAVEPLSAQVAVAAPERTRSLSPHDELRDVLRVLGALQARHHATHATYAATLAEVLDGTRSPFGPESRILVIAAGAGGWSAVAAHAGVPGVRCAVHSGDAPPPLASSAEPGEPVCEGDAELVVYDFTRPVPLAGFEPPTVRSCKGKLPFPAPPGRAVLEFEVRSNGKVPPAPVRLVETDGHLTSFAAIRTIHDCRLEPARLNGRAIRSVVRMPVSVRGSE